MTGMLAKFIAQIDLVDSKQLNVTEQSVMLSSYPSVEMKGRQWSPEERLLSESAEKKTQQGKKQKPRDSFDVDRNILVLIQNNEHD